jgi:hypothetical protein
MARATTTAKATTMVTAMAAKVTARAMEATAATRATTQYK